MMPAQLPSTAMDILNTQLPQDTIALWWLGQAGFVLRSSSSIVFSGAEMMMLLVRKSGVMWMS